MIDSPDTEFSKKFLGTKSFQVVDEVWPEMQDIVSRKSFSFLDDDSLPTEKCDLNGNSQTTWSTTDDQHLVRWQNRKSHKFTPMMPSVIILLSKFTAVAIIQSGQYQKFKEKNHNM